MTKTIHGTIHGRIIELDEDLGVVEGQEVEVQVKVIARKKAATWPAARLAARGDGDCGRHDGRALDRRGRSDSRSDRAWSPSTVDAGAPAVSFLLDTNILSAHLRRRPGLFHRFIQHSGRLFTSAVSLAELY